MKQKYVILPGGLPISPKTIWKCIFVLLLALLGAVLASTWPVQLGELYTGISGGSIHSLRQCVLAFGLFGACCFAAEGVAILRRVLLDCIIASHEAELRQASVEKLLKMPVSYSFGCISGEKTAQLNQGIVGLSQFLKIVCNDISATALTAACMLWQVFRSAPAEVAGVMALYLVLVTAVSVLQLRSQNGIREDLLNQKNMFDGQVCQAVSNLEFIRSLHAERYERLRLRPSALRICAAEKRHHRYMGKFDTIKQACKVAFQLVILALSVVLIGSGRMAPGATVTVCLLFQQLTKPIDEIYRFMDETASSLVKTKSLANLFQGEEDPVFSIPGGGPMAHGGGITLENVTICAPDGKTKLAHYRHIQIPGGTIAALTGESGSGKTCLARCLARFYPYTQGTVKLFGKDISTYSQQELFECLCYLPQNAFFFSGTVRDNLIYGLSREPSDQELLDALEKACILDELQQAAEKAGCPNALWFTVTEAGKNFSGGQKQRLILARAFLRTPRIYLLDESTANLDGGNMEAVLNNLELHARQHGAGILYISHDAKVIDRCKRVIPVNNLLKSKKQAA